MRRITLAAAAAALAAALGTPAAARADCAAPPSLEAIGAALERSGARVAEGKPLTIVTIGSSSTLGVGASRPELSYPSRLEAELGERFPKLAIRVVNHGVGGEEVGDEVKRLGHDVLAEQPDLVIWQVGTNAVLRHDDLSADAPLIDDGVGLIKGHGIDLVLMDLQYAPRVLARPNYDEMERLIADAAGRDHVGLFHRFAIMQLWAETKQLDPEPLIRPDGVHMTDASYGCLAHTLAEALAWDWWSQVKLAKTAASQEPANPTPAVAGLERGRAAPAGEPR
jgi:acyl-CoA thioesterase I